MGFNDEPMIKQKTYSENEYKAKKEKTFKVARRNIIMGEVSFIAGVNIFVSLALFILLMLGIGAMPYFMDVNITFTPENFQLRGGYFGTLCIVFLIIFSIACMWYAISYKRLEIMCIHLDGGLDGAAEVNEAARKDNSLNHEGIFGVGYHSLGGPAAVSYNYLVHCGKRIVNPIVFKASKWIYSKTCLALRRPSTENLFLVAEN